ncbi:MAG: ribbon-helix-helix domain-containing protein [Halobacteriaceae archaeon]
MPTISFTIDAELQEQVDDLKEQEYDGNRSEALNDLIRKGLDYDELQQEKATLEQQLQATNQRIDAVNDVVTYVEDEVRYRRAGLLQRLKWKITGMPDDRE